MTINQAEPPSNPDQQNPQPRTLESVEEELRNLIEENNRLREKLKELDTIQELLVHRVTEKSQNKILGLAVTGATIFSVFLFLLGEGIIKDWASKYLESETLKDNLASKTAQIISQDSQLIGEIGDKVAFSLGEQQQFKIEAEVEAQLERKFPQTAQVLGEIPAQAANAIKPSITKPDYFVVAGSSQKKSDLESELGRVKKLLGNDSFDDKGIYSETKICRPKKGNRFSALVIAENKTLPEALEIVEGAKKDGFRKDTYQLRRDKAFFDCSG